MHRTLVSSILAMGLLLSAYGKSSPGGFTNSAVDIGGNPIPGFTLALSGSGSAHQPPAVSASSDGVGTPGTTWTLRAAPLWSVTYGNGRFVAVGEGGTILTSPDGFTWAAQASGTAKWLYGVTYGNGRFVAVGEGGTILTSPDGFTWAAQASGTTKWLYGVTYGNGRFVAVGEEGTILTSP